MSSVLLHDQCPFVYNSHAHIHPTWLPGKNLRTHTYTNTQKWHEMFILCSNKLSSWHTCTHTHTHNPHTHATHSHTSTPRAPGLHVAACGRETPWYLLGWPLAFNHCMLKLSYMVSHMPQTIATCVVVSKYLEYSGFSSHLNKSLTDTPSRVSLSAYAERQNVTLEKEHWGSKSVETLWKTNWICSSKCFKAQWTPFSCLSIFVHSGLVRTADGWEVNSSGAS